jgi:glycolate oxidase
MIPAPAKDKLAALLGSRGYLDRAEDLLLYEYDGSVDKARPEMVVFPRSTEDVAAIVKIAREFGIPIVGRGAGTGLSGGSIPRAGGIVVGFSRMNRILELDFENERAVLQPGVVNLDVTLAAQNQGYFYAPDPSSQRACTIGGNVAENAGGPHTLAYGVTTNHVLGLQFVTPDGAVYETGGKELDAPGQDLAGLLTGSEGTMALVTRVVVRLMRKPEMVKTLLAIYNSAEDAGDTVAEITARAITPVAVEMLDGVMLRMVEEATHAGYPIDAAAVLLIELEGMREVVEEQTEQIREACMASRARVPRGAQQRRARAALEGPQERVRRRGPGKPDLLRSGRRRATHADRAHPALHREDQRKVRTDDQQHFPCGRREHAPHHPVQCARAGRAREGEKRGRGHSDALHRCGRVNYGRARRRHGEK